MNPRVRAQPAAGGLAGEHVVLEVGARAERLRHLAGDLLGRPDERLHAVVDLRELRRVQVDRAARHEHLTAVLSERRTDWRDFASASLVMQHVLITCRSASSSGASAWPAASSARRASIASAWETLQPRNLTANDATVAAR